MIYRPAILLLVTLLCATSRAEAQTDSRSIRLLLDYSTNGELLAGALSRSAFEAEFQATGYSNRRLTADDLRPWDVVVTAYAAPADENTVTAYKQFLSRGGGLVVLPTAMTAQNCTTEVRKIEASAACTEGLYHSGPGHIRFFSSNFIAIGGNPTAAFSQFRSAVVEAGANRVGERTLTPTAYYGEDFVLPDPSGRLDLVVDHARAGDYQTQDQGSMLMALDRTEAFAGFRAPAKIRYESKPCALSVGVFVWGASNMVDRLCGARVPGQLAGIFAHEAAHIFQHQFDLRYFNLPGFGEGIFQEVGIAGDFSQAVRALPASPSSLYLWYMLIRDQGAAHMQTFFASLATYDPALMPGFEYWDTLYAAKPGGIEKGSLYLRRAQNVINYFFSKAFARNYTQTAIAWGFEGTEDWQPVETAIAAAQACSVQRGQASTLQSSLRSILRKFYEGNFETAGGMARSLSGLCGSQSAADLATPVSAASYEGPVFAPDSFIAVFGQGFSTRTEVAPIPTTAPVAGLTARFIDPSGREWPAPVYVVTPNQVNLLAPADAPLGGYLIRLDAAGRSFAGVAALDSVAPALFSANASGTGVAAAYITLVSRNGAQRSVFVSSCGSTPGSCVAAPVRIDWANESAYLVLFGAGIRGRSSLAKVQVLVAGRVAQVQYAGVQPTCVGLDQVNVELPSTLAGLRSELEVRLTVDGKKANVVTVRLM